MKDNNIKIRISSYDHRLLDKFVVELYVLLKRNEPKVFGPIPMPTRRRLYTVIRSPHIFKDSREHFIKENHIRMIIIDNCSARTINSLSKINVPPGINIDIKQEKSV